MKRMQYTSSAWPPYNAPPKLHARHGQGYGLTP